MVSLLLPFWLKAIDFFSLVNLVRYIRQRTYHIAEIHLKWED